MPKENPEQIFTQTVLKKMNFAQEQRAKLESEQTQILERMRLLLEKVENKEIKINEAVESTINPISIKEMREEIEKITKEVREEYGTTIRSVEEIQGKLENVKMRINSLEALAKKNIGKS